jgi:putative ABC transport system permease protein
MPADFESVGGEPQLWRLFEADYDGGRGSYTVLCVARLKPGVTTKQAQAEMDSITAALAKENPRLKTGVGALVESLPALAVRDVRTALLALWGVVGFVLLIACANVAGLLLARAASREREIALRLVLGAGRGRLVRQLLTESILLSLVGGAAGCLFAAWGIEALRSLGAASIPRMDEVALDNTVLAFAFGLSLLAGVLAGAIPAFQSGRPDLNQALKESGHQATTAARQPVRSALVVAQLALAVVVLVGAGLLIRSYSKLLEENPGFNPENLLTLRLEPVRAAQYRSGDSSEAYWRQRAAERETLNQFYQQLISAIETLPGVRSVAGINQLPLQGTYWAVLLTFEGRPPAPPGEAPAAQSRVVTPGYFQTMEIPVSRGRAFTQRDDAGALGVAVVNETLARMHWPDEDPIGKRITTEDPANSAWLTIVGVVGDVRPISLEEPPRPTLYVPFAQARLGFARTWQMNLVVRAEEHPQALVPGARTLVWNLDDNLPISNISTMEEILADSLARRRFSMLLLGLFALVALLLALVGVYGVVSYTVTQRTREIGIRIALGALPADILRITVRQGLVLALLGSGLGIAGATGLTRFVKSLLFGIEPTDPLTFAGVPLALIAIALLACYVPARRATRVDPMVALRYE